MHDLLNGDIYMPIPGKRSLSRLYRRSWRTALDAAMRNPATRRAIAQTVFQDRYFEAWEALGYHVLPVSYSSPIPEVRTLSGVLWERPSVLSGIDMRDEEQLELVETITRYQAEYAFPVAPTTDPQAYYQDNPMYNEADAAVLYALARELRPQRIVEVGSGFSTRITARAARENGTTRLICIEPDPVRLVRDLPGLTELVQQPVQQVPVEFFEQLGKNDLLFIDSSHVSKIGSDVNYLILEVLPRLRPGVLVHFHDIFFPNEYPRERVVQNHWFWNEQYILQAFLALNIGYEVVLATHYLYRNYPERMRAAFPHAYPTAGGGSVWIRRCTLPAT
jgi:predicted O-methyltransferase YrrM